MPFPTISYDRITARGYPGMKRMRSGALTGTTFAIGFTDLSSTETGGCTQAIVMKEPTIMRGVQSNQLEWAIFCPCWQKGTVQVNAV